MLAGLRYLSATMTFTIVYVALALGVPLLTFAVCLLGQKMLFVPPREGE